jgi:SAM-dependent methyltransferase
MAEPTAPAWFGELLGTAIADGTECTRNGRRYVMSGGVLRGESLLSPGQTQTSETFGFKWHKRDTFEGPEQLRRMREWLVERYGDVTREPWFAECGQSPLVLDAGCGGAMSVIELFGTALASLRYVGVDVSTAVDVARSRFMERGWNAGFVQSDLMALPFAQKSFDLIFSEGVLHHTDSTEAALKALSPLLKPGGRFLFYVYRKKGPLREYTDDYIRDLLQRMTPQQAWDAMMPLTKLGRALGELDIEIEIPESIDLLGIPAGRINLQRLFYWHVCKAFYRPELTLEEMNHINYDWYAPRNAHRQTEEQVRRWCAESGLSVERERIEEAGITIVARRQGPG